MFSVSCYKSHDFLGYNKLPAARKLSDRDRHHLNVAAKIYGFRLKPILMYSRLRIDLDPRECI